MRLQLACLFAACTCAALESAARAADPPAPPVAAPDKTADGAETSDAPHPGSEVVLLRTVIVGASDDKTGRSTMRDATSAARAHQLDQVLSDAIQDFGLTLDLSETSSAQDEHEITDLELVARAAKARRWVVYPSLDLHGSDLVVRLAGVAPGSKAVVVRTESVKPAELAVRGVVMLRDVMALRPAGRGADGASKHNRAEPAPSFATPARSQGRAILAFNSALFGGFVGYAVQRSSGNDDPRLLFPLMALGTGVGLGASAVVAEEWDVGIGDAWFLSGAAWWPALSGLFLARSRERSDPSTEYSFALVGGLSGLGLATTSLALVGGMSQGGALLTHSGSAFGTFLGAMTEFAYRGTTEGAAPHRGLGIGAAAGFVVSGTVATFVDIDPSRVLILDLGAGLGGLAGAAATSPFIVRERTQGGDRAFVLTTMGATVAGGVAAWFWTRKASAPRTSRAMMMPFAGVIGESETAQGREPIFGAGLTGALP